MTKKRKTSSSVDSPADIEVKEENVFGNDYLIAKGRFHGVLRQLTEKSDSDSENESKSRNDAKKRKSESEPTAFRHTYVMKLFDRSVDLARFQEDTPLYPICRAWMANQPRNPQPILKRRVSTPEPDHSIWTSENVFRLPPPSSPFVSRIPSPIPEQMQKDKNNILNNNHDDKSVVPRDVLIKNHLKRWVAIKKKWIQTAVKNEERYSMSKQILQTIYNKAQEGMMGE